MTETTSSSLMQIDNSTEPTTKVYIAGSPTIRNRMTKEQLLRYLSDLIHPENVWIFALGQFVLPAQLAETDWETVGTVRITPALVGNTLEEDTI
mgnify:CR=1 FL=1